MKLRLLPRQEDAYFGLFEAAADNVVAAATALLDLLSDPADAEVKAKHLLDLEHEGDRITREILTRLATTFIARFDRDEIYALSNGHRVVLNSIHRLHVLERDAFDGVGETEPNQTALTRIPTQLDLPRPTGP